MGKRTPFRLILASGSPARRELLARAGYEFEVIPSDVEEPAPDEFADARGLVQHTAWLKARAVAEPIAVDPAGSVTWVLAADTVAWVHGQVVLKPADEEDARRILRALSGTEHELWTGVCLWRRPGDHQVAWQELSRVRMKGMTEEDLDVYLASRQWQGCSGAYAIRQDDPYVTLVDGSLTNVVGLPMESTVNALQGG